MTPYYHDARVALYHGDWRDVLPRVLVPGGYDHVVVDPPYDPETHKGARSDLRPGYKVRFDPLPDVQELVSACRPRRWSLSFCSLEMLGDYRRAARDLWVRSGLWDRTDGAPQLSGDRPAQPAEGIAIWHAAGAKRWNGGGKRAIWRHGVVRGDERVHETQKPVGLMRDLLLDFTDVGETVVDLCAGSGTTGVAAKMCGRIAVLIELKEEHCERAAVRLADAQLDERIARVPGIRSRQRALELEP